jgi:hypothetical protein
MVVTIKIENFVCYKSRSFESDAPEAFMNRWSG